MKYVLGMVGDGFALVMTVNVIRSQHFYEDKDKITVLCMGFIQVVRRNALLQLACGELNCLGQVRPKDRQSLTCLDYIVTLYEIDKEASGYGSCFCLSFRQPRQFMCFKFSMLDDIDF
uniref:Uncharacterized protein n=1 Tax=Populus trichocarpa TaxID=3694 RepID=A0A2K2AK43_POPTR